MKVVVLEKRELSDRERHFIETQHHCALCNAELSLHIQKGQDTYSTEEVLEEASCLQCNIKTRVKSHAVQ